MKKYLLLAMLMVMTSQLSFALETPEVPAGYVKLHSGAVVPIEDLQPASNKYLNVESRPNKVYTTPATEYKPNKTKYEPKFTGFFGRGFDFFGINTGNFNFGVMK